MYLTVMRHAKSDWNSPSGDDLSRSLNARGIEDARRMGEWMSDSQTLPELILCSPATRVRETIHYLALGAGLNLSQRTRWLDSLYLSSLGNLLDVVRQNADATELMLVGHNPGLEELLEMLLPGGFVDSQFAKPMPTCAYYRIRLASEAGGKVILSAGSATLIRHQRPKALREKGS